MKDIRRIFVVLAALPVTCLMFPGAAEAAVTRTGAVGNFGNTNNVNGGAGNSITVPADAELMILTVNGFSGEINYYSGGSIAIDGQALSVAFDGDSDDTVQQAMIYSMDVRSLTGTRAITWDWAGSNDNGCGANVHYAFYKGVDMTSPIRDSGGQSGFNDFTTGSLTAVSGDIIAATTATTDNTTLDWTNVTQVRQDAFQCNLAYFAEASPSGDTTVSSSITSGDADGTLGAVVIAAFSSGPPITNNCPSGWTDIGSGQCRKIITTTGASTLVVPVNWNNSSNLIEVIGGGGGGFDPAGSGTGGGGGGGGGAYTQFPNVQLTANSSVTAVVGTLGAEATNGGDSFVCNVLDSGGTCDAITDGAVVIGAKGGQAGQAATTGGSGGAEANGFPTSGTGLVRNSGGNGGNGNATTDGGGGGGGAGGPHGDGGNGSNADGTAGGIDGGGGGGGDGGEAGGTDGTGQGGDGITGAGGGATQEAAGTAGTGGGGAGSNGTETAGAGATGDGSASGTGWGTGIGSGGGGGGADNTGTGGGGGNYGGGGGGGEGNGGSGGQGIIVITYTPGATPSRTLRLFGGMNIKLYNGTVKLYPR